MVHRQLLEGGHLFHDLRALVRELVVLGLGGGVAAEVVAAEQCRIGGLDADLGMEVVRRQLLEGGRLFHDLRALVRELVVLGLGGGVAAEVVAAEQCRIGGLDADLGMEVVRRQLLEGGRLFHDLRALVRELVVLGLGGGVAVEVVAAEAGTVGGGDADLGMRVVHRGLLEGTRLGEDASPLLRDLELLSLGGGVSGEVVPAEDGRIGPLEEEVAVEADLLGVEVCHREYLQGSGVVEDAKALGESLVQLGVLCSGDGDR